MVCHANTDSATNVTMMANQNSCMNQWLWSPPNQSVKRSRYDPSCGHHSAVIHSAIGYTRSRCPIRAPSMKNTNIATIDRPPITTTATVLREIASSVVWGS
jgi:hypothetical protein